MANLWHKEMYDETFANLGLSSKDRIIKAKSEVQFIDKVLNLSDNKKVLDVPCGVGRHSYLIAKKKCFVTAIDISSSCLKIARQKFSHHNINYLKGDMSKLESFYSQYDIVLNLFSSFGYFKTDAQNKKVLKNFYKCLNEQGALVLSTINREWLLKVYKENYWMKSDNNYFLVQNSYNTKTKYNESTFTIINPKTGFDKSYYHRIRLYSKKEMIELLKEVGFKKIKIYGDEFGNKFEKYQSTHPFYIAYK